jgi:hypothetical protein
MRYHDCDQIGNDLFVAMKSVQDDFGETCVLTPEIAEQLIEEVETLDRRPRRTKHAIELVLHAHDFEWAEEQGYRLALTKIFGRRKGAARDERISLYKATDFPRGQAM